MDRKLYIKYYQAVKNHLLKHKIAYCWTDAGEFLTLDACDDVIKDLKTKKTVFLPVKFDFAKNS